MFFDAFKRMLGIPSNPPENRWRRYQDDPSLFQPSERDSDPDDLRHQPPVNVFDMDADLNHIHDIMDQQMRSIFESFNFLFGSQPFVPGEEDGAGGNSHGRHSGGFFPFSFGVQDIPDQGITGIGIPRNGFPGLQGPQENLDPRNEVLKPEFRNKPIIPPERRDENLDNLVQNEGPGVILDLLKPNANEGPNESSSSVSPKSWFWSSASPSARLSTSSSVTVYRNINGHSTMERIVRHPDGRVERTVIQSDSDHGVPTQPLQPLE